MKPKINNKPKPTRQQAGRTTSTASQTAGQQGKPTDGGQTATGRTSQPRRRPCAPKSAASMDAQRIANQYLAAEHRATSRAGPTSSMTARG